MQYENISVSPELPSVSAKQKFALALHSIGWLLLLVAALGGNSANSALFLILTFGFLGGGGLYYAWESQMNRPKGVAHHHIWLKSFSNRGLWGYMVAMALTGFYVLYYWGKDIFGFEVFENLYRTLDPLSLALRGEKTQPWFFYGTLYTFAVIITGFRAIFKYRHNRYQILRTSSIMVAQTVLSWLVPAILVLFQQPEKYLNYAWPLSYTDLWPGNFIQLLDSPAKLSMALLVWGLAFTFVLTPVLTYYYGKRWYCSWVCGCGGLANTLGDPWRQLSDKSEKAWVIEKKTIYSVLGLIVLTTILLWVSYAFGIVNGFSTSMSKWYGFLIGSVFSGVIGVGFYPIFGTRVWCRFGCPQAAILGILQRVFSRFRITTNGAQCISCGNCSTYCEMGIDVRAYAQKGENIIRASCVGCGMCANACPRGVLSLENGPGDGRYNESISLLDQMKSGISQPEKPSASGLWNSEEK